MNVFAYMISLELHTFVNLLFAKEKEKKTTTKQTKKHGEMLSCYWKQKISWVIIISCICVALGFSSRDYWWPSIFKPNSLRYKEISVDP